jgi:hypothetical protein
MSQIIIRFLVSGIVVSAFALIGDLFKLKSFAGLFGAAPSVALAVRFKVEVGHARLFRRTRWRGLSCLRD